MITSILVLFHLLISLIVRLISFSGCSHYLEASQLIDNNQLTGFSVRGVSVERHFWAISKIIFFVNRIFLLLLVERLALVFFICMITFYCFSTLVCANLVGKIFSRYGGFDLRSTFIGTVPWRRSLSGFRPFFCCLERLLFKNDGYFDLISWDSKNFQQATFCPWIKA